jgi:hypothetical protein
MSLVKQARKELAMLWALLVIMALFSWIGLVTLAFILIRCASRGLLSKPWAIYVVTTGVPFAEAVVICLAHWAGGYAAAFASAAVLLVLAVWGYSLCWPLKVRKEILEESGRSIFPFQCMRPAGMNAKPQCADEGR